MPTAVKTFVVAFVVFTVVGSATVLALGIVADLNGWSSFDVSLGPVTAFAFDRDGSSTSTTFGSGIALGAVVLAAVNAAVAGALGGRSPRSA